MAAREGEKAMDENADVVVIGMGVALRSLGASPREPWRS
jgi:hypothetical protein